MADKSINELVAASSIGATDLFVLQQDNTAKKLPGHVLLNWLTAAADGHGGIQKIAKISSSGLSDTYRITLADTTTFDFVVTNGKSVRSIVKTATSGLVDTYTISYNDGTTEKFKVTNGAKGDPGNDANVWIRYASQKPAADSHSFGEIPDAWIGIAPGHLPTAPTDWQAYTWYQWKGEKGDTGDPAKRLSVEYAYQVGDTGNVIPSGTWLATIPNVPQGKFLWIRKTTTWNVGDPDVDYSISRMGLDGSGSVSSVANISPDENGNVPLTAEDIGALPNTGGDMNGAINMNGHTIRGLNAPTEDDEPATKGYAVAKANVVNKFTTTVEGFVADARALKVLNDKFDDYEEFNLDLYNSSGTLCATMIITKVWRIVSILFVNQGVQQPTAVNMATKIPEKYRNAYRYSNTFFLIYGGNSQVGRVKITSDGTVSIIAPAEWMYGNVTYISNEE